MHAIARHSSSSDETSDELQDPHIDSDDSQSSVPKVARWVDEEELDEVLSSDIDSKEESSNIAALKRDLSELPLGALVKAQKVVKAAPRYESDDGSSPSSESLAARSVAGTSTQKNKRPIDHRPNKHAPMEVTSKKPVPRRRQVVEVRKAQPRDPRFSNLSGTLSVDRFRSQYGFLSELHTEELSALKGSLVQARKLLSSSPRNLREEREQEVKRLELALKRAESTVNVEKRDEAERNALKELQREEKDRRKSGKKAWWLKEADKKAVRVRARLDAIAASGGKRAVKKAIEKRRRKIGQKEKKSRPFAPPQKRQRENEGNQTHPKRRRILKE